ncbi:heavy metal sensor histidine kinase [Propionivibrio sp.]|uniref:heavy metal sensor histidine kinase n=1 Tax=Propionivibrio sp. TaxID=2212460 RepID=UPI003BF187D3
MRLNQRASITLRLTVFFASASTVVLLLLGYLIAGAVEQHFVEQDMDVLTGKLDLTRHALLKVRSDQDLISIPQQLDDSLVGRHGLAVVVVAPDGQTMFATSGAEFPQALLERKIQADALHPVVWKTARNTPFRGIATLAETGIKDASPAIVAVATDISHHEHFMNSFRVTLWSFVIVAALLTGFLGWVAVRRGLAPLQAIRQKAEGITAHKLDARLTLDWVPAELADLVDTLNAMLSRLEESFRRLSDFSSDLAHELRTPVSNLLTQTQVTLSRTRTPDEYRDVLVSNVEEFERLSRMIADMLFIAKADEGQIVPSREKMELEQVAADLIDFYRLIADEKGIALSSSGNGQIMGDSLMIRRAISNLLSNAIRHTESGGSVSVAIEPYDASRVSIVVTNSGATIPAIHLPRLFDRFYRADPSRHWEGTHSGLGLAIVKSIVQAHGGEVSVQSAAGNTSFIMVIPRVD